MNRLSGIVIVLLFGAAITVSAPPAGAGVAKGYATVGGNRLYYEVEGEGCPIVLIAGGGGMDLRQWDGEFAAFAGHHRTVRFDPRGVGRSDTPNTSYSNVADLRAVLDALSIEKAILVGVSSGGGIALDFAIVHPERVSGLVLSAPLVRGFEMSEDQKKRVAGFAQASQKSVADAVRAFLDDPYFVPAPGNPEARRVAEKLMIENARDISPGLSRELEPPTVSRLGEVRAPTLLLVGGLDHPDLHRRVEFLAGAIPGSTKRTIPGAGHMLNLEKPREFSAESLEFVRRRVCP